MVVLLKRLYVHKMSRVMMTMMVMMMMMMMVRLRFISNLYDFTCHSIMISFQKWCTMFYNCLTATYQWLREERISGQVCQFSDMKQFVCHQVAFMEKFCGRIGQVIVIYHPILCYSPTLQPHQLPSKMVGAADLHNKEFAQK